MFFLCIFLPPIAALISGGFISFLLNILLSCLGWIPGVIHAFMVVNNNKAEERNQEQIAAIREQTEVLKNKEEKTEEG